METLKQSRLRGAFVGCCLMGVMGWWPHSTYAAPYNLFLPPVSGDWSVNTNWTGPDGVGSTVPTSTEDAYLGNANFGIAFVTLPGAVAGNLFIGHNVPSGLEVQSGDLTVSSIIALGDASYAPGYVTQTGGVLSYGAGFFIGNGGTGTYTLVSGVTTGAQFRVGSTADGFANQSGGINYVQNLLLGFYPGLGASGPAGIYNLSGGTLSSAGLNPDALGAAGRGTLNQTGGTYENRGNFSLAIGNVAASATNNTGIYNLTSGTFSMKAGQNFIIGDTGNGTWNIGDASGTANIVQVGAGGLGIFTVRNTAGASGTIRGWGNVSFGGPLVNNGRIIADGYGTDRTLAVTNVSSVANSIENTSNNGWFAVNKGKLTLPTLSISSGTSTKVWGESAGDTTPDLVNSVKLQLNSIASGGNLEISLLSAGRADVPASPDGRSFLGIWDFATSGGFSFGGGSADLIFRFDNTADQGADLKLWHYDGSWTLLTSSFNDTDHTISTSGVNSFSLFAITVPEPSVFGLLLSAAVLLRYRRRHAR